MTPYHIELIKEEPTPAPMRAPEVYGYERKVHKSPIASKMTDMSQDLVDVQSNNRSQPSRSSVNKPPSRLMNDKGQIPEIFAKIECE